MSRLVLSIFPGVGILDAAFAEAGFCVVRGPDLLWGGDIRRFNAPAGKFDGVIGGPPCQEFSAFANLVRAQGRKPKYGNLIPEFERVIVEAAPLWFVMENVRSAPIPKVAGYEVDPALLNNRWLGQDQSRVHRFSFGYCGELRRLHFETEALESPRWEPRVLASSGGTRTPRYHNRRDVDIKRPRRLRPFDRYVRGTKSYFEHAKALQGLPAEWDLPGFTIEAKCRAVGDAVPLFMGRVLVKAVLRALGDSPAPAADEPRGERDRVQLSSVRGDDRTTEQALAECREALTRVFAQYVEPEVRIFHGPRLEPQPKTNAGTC